MVRAAIILLITGLLALHSVRTAAVRAAPEGAGRTLWPGHPQVQLWQVMTEVGTRARAGQTLTPEMMERVEAIARKAPLAPEPLLIKGALAQLDGRQQHAERLFAEAAHRAPRSEAARYFLAERYLTTGRMPKALVEMAALARLIPGATEQFAPALAQFAQSPGAVPALRGFLRSSPEFEAPVLFELARLGRNADLVLALWSGDRRPTRPDWRERLVAALVEEREFAKAHAVWRRVSGAGETKALLFNPEFRKLPAPPPFNWRLSSKGGVAGPSGEGGLDVVYFGREDVTLAEQMMLLGPGRFELSMNLSSGSGEGSPLRWKVDCLPGGQTLLQLPLEQAQQPRRVAANFAVPSGCEAQRLRLAGEQPEFPGSVELRIRGLRLKKAGGQ